MTSYIIPQEPVASSNIAARGYDLTRQVLAVTFTSGVVYHYGSVPAAVAEAFFNAESAGKFFAAHIKSKFPGERMTGKCAKCGDIGPKGERCDSCGCAAYETEPRLTIEGERSEHTTIGGQE